ncbi:Lysophospholipase D GDPD1-like [Homarus americanus]|uniref:Lysophospholipase D GDPD1-like n=1 Tax=Homarus americanus TaxID=6706 RepID=A0A8J5MP11_HOMAM|nr:Lysophospholipase D GDPD1-like [Homarus americanus]
MLELDCQLTRDGQVVVSHDSVLDIRTELKGAISEYNYAELPPIKDQIPIDFMPGLIFSSINEDRRIPLLEETFHHFPNTPINIDIKIDSNELISKVSDLVKKYQREHITVWGNMKDVVTQKCYKEVNCKITPPGHLLAEPALSRQGRRLSACLKQLLT